MRPFRVILSATVLALMAWAAPAVAQLDPLANAGHCTVSTGYDAAATSIVVTTGCGTTLPTALTNYTWCNGTDYPISCKNSSSVRDPNYEIVRCSRSGETLTCTRAQEDTSASTKNTGGKTYWLSVFTNKTFTDINTALGATFVTTSTNSVLTNESVLTGTANQVIVTGTTLSTPQDIHTAANPAFNRVHAGTSAATRSTTQPTNAFRCFDGTAPAGTLTNGVDVYCDAGELKAMDAGGTVTNLTLPFTSTIGGIVPASGGSATDFLKGNGTWGPASGGAPGGADTNIQYNDAGALGGEAAFTYNKTTNQAVIPGLEVTEDFALSGDDAPAQITAQQDNYSISATATVVRVDADLVRAITGIAGGVDGREIRFINDGGGDSVLIFRRDDAASTAANRIDMSSDIALGPKESITLWYNSTDSRWNLISHTASPVIMARHLPFYSHEMNHNGGQNPWDHPFFALGAGGQSKVAGIADHPGIWRCSSAAAANTGCNLQTEFAHTLLTGGEFSEVVFRVNVIAGTRLSAGFHDSSGGTGSTDAATFHIVEGGDASCRTANNNTTTTTSLGVTLVVATWYRARVQVNNDATTVTCTLFSATGDQLATVDVTTNIPTGAGRVMGHAMTATVTTATAQDLVDIDYMAYGRRRAVIR